mmetsp:Transcript_89565/g.168712  ORF Transcript_89565/g.168712 Transcript_89565/m.168712 type:complete len:83 (-) Transcript_89565:13-261(-)
MLPGIGRCSEVESGFNKAVDDLDYSSVASPATSSSKHPSAVMRRRLNASHSSFSANEERNQATLFSTPAETVDTSEPSMEKQ